MRAAIASEFNIRLRELLKQEGISQKMLAEFAGVPGSVLRRWLTGEVNPSVAGACKVAKVFRVTLNDLIPPEVYK